MRRNDIQLTIVLIVRDLKDSPVKVLDSLSKQTNAGRVDVIVVDGRPSCVGHDHIGVFRTFLALRAPGENMPRLKAIGAETAVSSHVAFLEPKAVPSADWLQSVWDAIHKHPDACFGGPVIFASEETPSDQAAYIFEYGMFTSEHICSGTNLDLPGNNMILPRTQLQHLCADILESEGLNKPFCQKRLKDGGCPIYLDPGIRVFMTTEHRLFRLLRSRFSYARCYGGTRIALFPPMKRWLYRAGAPAISALLVFKHWPTMRRLNFRKRRISTFLSLTLLCLAWGGGEALGYWLGRGKACNRLY